MNHVNLSAFADWLGRYADATGVDGAALARDQTLLINSVLCTFVHPAMGRDDIAAVLVDAGAIESPVDDHVLRTAMGRNLENFLLGAPQFLFNSESQRLVIGQWFEFGEIEPAAIAPILDALALQAQAWHRREE
ncbi:hypothetical protein J2W35_004156 [Variovorax boronicumulans]|uniref:hypothetical protein n=1 Tax=Variovorax boronicumulans TaxID=436515 RepID=UPI0027802F1D|nr:hypothetical protein [Variovorax boronicumulans]MDQ0083790.1 hypothetical protein [Variovorax boronicumulans]